MRTGRAMPRALFPVQLKDMYTYSDLTGIWDLNEAMDQSSVVGGVMAICCGGRMVSSWQCH